jgi:spore cortex biosynthesis protein YabQ
VGVSLSEQARCFLASLLLGFILSLLYDLLRAVRLRRATKRRFTSALDLLYCAAFALLTFLFALRIGGGELRLYMLCSALFGAVSYFTLCARLFRPLWAFWAEVLFSFARLAAAPLRWLQKVYGKLAKLCKRYFLFSRNRLIIKSYERSARYSLRRARKKEAHRHDRAGQKRQKAHQLSHDARHRNSDRTGRGAAHSSAEPDRRRAQPAHRAAERS